MSTKYWHEDQIKALLQRSDRAVERALLALLERQTQTEKQTESTLVRNSEGFLPGDATYMTAWAEQVRRGEKLSRGQLRHLRAGTNKKPDRPRIGKYSRQLCEIANERLREIDAQLEHLKKERFTHVEMADTFQQGARDRARINREEATWLEQRKKLAPKDPTAEESKADLLLAMELKQ